MVQVGALRGFVDGTGRIVIEPTWDDASPFSEGLAVVATGIQRTPNRALGAPVESGGKRGYIDRDGKIVIAPRFAWAKPFSGGVAWVSEAESFEERTWGLIDRTGKYVVEPRYRVEPGEFSEGLCAVWEGGEWSTEASAERFAYIDASGAAVIPARFRAAGPFSEGLAAIVKGGKLGFIDRSGDVKIEPRFEWGSVNLNTRLPYFSEGLAPIPLRGRYGYIDLTGKVVIEPRFEASTFSAAMNQIEPDKEMEFRDGLAAVVVGGKTGFIDREGREVIPAQFSSADSFEGGIARVTVKRGYWGYIRRDGTFLWNPLAPIGK